MKGCSYTGNCSWPGGSYSFSSALPEATYSHSPALESPSLGYVNSANAGSPDMGYNGGTADSPDGYSNLPSQLDYHISEALKEIEFKEQQEEQSGEMLPAVRSEIREVPSEISQSEIVPVKSDMEIVPEQMMQNQMMERDQMGNQIVPGNMMPERAMNLPPDLKPKRVTQVEEQIVIKRRVRSVEFSD